MTPCKHPHLRPRFRDLFVSRVEITCPDCGELLTPVGRGKTLRQILGSVALMGLLLLAFRGKPSSDTVEAFLVYMASMLACLLAWFFLQWVILRFFTRYAPLPRKQEEKAGELSPRIEEEIDPEWEEVRARFARLEAEKKLQEARKDLPTEPSEEESLPREIPALKWSWRTYMPGTSSFESEDPRYILLAPEGVKKGMNYLLMFLSIAVLFFFKKSMTTFYLAVFSVLLLAFLLQYILVRWMSKTRRFIVKRV